MLKKYDELKQGERSQLHRCNLNTPFYITISDYGYEPEINTYIYHIEIGVKIGDSLVIIKQLNKRYSEIYAFWYKIYEKYKEVLNNETFPGKIWFYKNDKKKIMDRYEKMKKCLSKLCEINDERILQMINDF